MSKIPQNEYEPDYVYPPGETLLETIEEKGMSQAELAVRTGYSKKTINQIVRGKAPITPEVALRLELTLGVPAAFWNELERNYQEWLTRQEADQRLKTWIDWLKEMPIRQMIRFGWITASSVQEQQVFETLRFFGVASPEAWRELYQDVAVQYRQSSSSQVGFGATSAWLRKGEIAAQAIDCAPFDQQRFRNTLHSIRALTRKQPEEFQDDVIRVCAEAGVAVAFVPELPKTGISGATRWLHPGKALIQLSLRYKTDDQLWFTFFHEAAHIILHGKRDTFLDVENGASVDDKEEEANTFARDLLISPSAWAPYKANGDTRSKVGIERFAAEVGIAPGIVVGRLQREGILPYSHCNELKQRLMWADTSVNE